MRDLRSIRIAPRLDVETLIWTRGRGFPLSRLDPTPWLGMKDSNSQMSVQKLLFEM
jgi:hypothetical protein